MTVADTPTSDDIATRYVTAGLRLGRHNPDIVDAYYGPPALRERVDEAAIVAPAAIATDLQSLLGDLDGSAGADLDAQRRAWLRAQTLGLLTVAEKLDGADIAYADEVERCYGVRPVAISDDEVGDAHAGLDRALGGDGSLFERIAALRERHVIPVDRLRGVIANLADHLSQRTRDLFGLPEGERVDFDLVTDKPYSGFNFYQGDFVSRVTINTDLPVLSTSIAHLVSHEAYPGHHTEHCHKEAGLYRRRRQIEESIALIGTPSCLMAEGLADLGLEILVGDHPAVAVEQMVRDAGAPYEVEAVAALAHFGEVMARARGTLALELHANGRDVDEVVAQAERWLVLDHGRAAKTVEFMTDRTWRAYVYCYAEGHRLCRRFVGGDPARFARLLDEQLTPADLVASES